MKVMVTGAAGMIGRKFCQALALCGKLQGRTIERLTMADAVDLNPPPNAPFPVEVCSGDLSRSGIAERLVAAHPDIVYHLAAIVSAEAETDFEKGYAVNLAGTQQLFEAIRHAGNRPKVVYASSIAVFGIPFPASIPEDYLHAPLTSYGTQKAIGELLLADYTRRRFFDGIGIRFPTICVRPGKPNKAASSFYSNIIREPLNGERTVLPVGEETRHWFASPRAATNFLFHAAELDPGHLESHRTLSMPGVSATVGEMLASLEKFGGPACVKLIDRRPDRTIQRIVEGWPQRLDTTRAEALGFRAESSFDEIVQAHIEDECSGQSTPGR